MRRNLASLALAIVAAASMQMFSSSGARAQCTDTRACLVPIVAGGVVRCDYFLPGRVTFGSSPIQLENWEVLPGGGQADYCTPPPPPGVPVDFSFTAVAYLRYSPDGGNEWLPWITRVLVHERAVGRADGVTFDVEMLSFDIGPAEPITSVPFPDVFGFRFRESPTLISPGQTVLIDQGDGTFHSDSFFDIFTELSIDAGATWTPSDGPIHMSLGIQGPVPARRATWSSLKAHYR